MTLEALKLVLRRLIIKSATTNPIPGDEVDYFIKNGLMDEQGDQVRFKKEAREALLVDTLYTVASRLKLNMELVETAAIEEILQNKDLQEIPEENRGMHQMFDIIYLARALGVLK